MDAVETLAAELAAAFDTGAVVTPPAGSLPADMPAAERLQDAMVARLGPIGGWKLGATIAAVRANLGLPHAFFGALPASRMAASGARIPASNCRAPGVEPEIAFRFARALPAGAAPASEDVIRAAVGSVHPAIEIPSTRFASLGVHGGFPLVGDNGAAGWIVVGPALSSWTDDADLDMPVTVLADGVEMSRGSPRAVDGGPFAALVDCVRRAHARGYDVTAGLVVATGSCAGYTICPAGKTIEARFADRGAVSAVFEAAP